MSTTTTRRPADALPDVRRAAAYGRISEDDQDKREGVDDQLARAEAHIGRRGWDLAGSFRDDDLSAYSGKPRPGYRALMAAVVAGDVDTIVVRHLDRLWRDDLDAAQGRAVLRQHRVLVAEYGGMEYPLWTAHGQHMARTMGGNATFESDVKSERVREASERRAEQGRMNGPCPYGWSRQYERTPSGRVVRAWEVEDPEAAEVVREITARLVRGDSLNAVTADLNARGVPAPGAAFTFRHKNRGVDNPDGSRWSKTSVRKLALRESNAGLRVFRKGADGERRVRGDWPPLVGEDQWAAVVDRLNAPGRDRRRTRPASRQHLLTWGVGRCGRCGGVLRVATKGGQRLYVCAEQNTLGRDGKPTSCTGRREQWVDELVRAVVVDRLSRPDALDLLAADGRELIDAEARVEALRGKLTDAAQRFAVDDRGWTAAQVDAVNAAVLPKLAEAEAEVRRLRRGAESTLLAEWIGSEVAARWDAADVHRRRALVEALGLRVTLLPTRRGPGFDPRSVRVEYATA